MTRSLVVTLAAPACLFALTSGPALAWIDCSANPFKPYCCPAPCPVNDGPLHSRLTALQSSVQTVVRQQGDILDGSSRMAISLGTPGQQQFPIPPAVMDSGWQNDWKDLTGGLDTPAFEAVRQVLDGTVRQSESIRTQVATPKLIAANASPTLSLIRSADRVHPARPSVRDGRRANLHLDLRGGSASDTAAQEHAQNFLTIPQRPAIGHADQLTWRPIYSTPSTPIPPVPPIQPDPLAVVLEQLNNALMLARLHASATAPNFAVPERDQARQYQASLLIQIASMVSGLFEDPLKAASAILAFMGSNDPTQWTSGRPRLQASTGMQNAVWQTLQTDPGRFGALRLQPSYLNIPQNEHGQQDPSLVFFELAENRKHLLWITDIAASVQAGRDSVMAAYHRRAQRTGMTGSAQEIAALSAQAIRLAQLRQQPLVVAAVVTAQRSGAQIPTSSIGVYP